MTRNVKRSGETRKVEGGHTDTAVIRSTTYVDTVNLLLPDGGVVDVENIDGVFLLQAVLVHTDDDIVTRVNASLLFGSALFDAVVMGMSTGIDRRK